MHASTHIKHLEKKKSDCWCYYCQHIPVDLNSNRKTILIKYDLRIFILLKGILNDNLNKENFKVEDKRFKMTL